MDTAAEHVDVDKTTEKLDEALAQIALNSQQSSIQQKVFMRRIHADDKDWNILNVKKLTDICQQVMANNFKSYPVFEAIPKKYKNKIIANLSTDLPLALASSSIPDSPASADIASNYWQRRAIATFEKCNMPLNGSWKQLFFQKHVEALLELYVPPILKEQPAVSLYQKLPTLLQKPKDYSKAVVVDESYLVGQLKMAAPYVKKLVIKQLRTNPRDEQGVHIDMKIIFDNLTNLQDIELYYGVRDCGVDFEWKLFGFKDYDCKTLSSSIGASQTLSRLVLQFSKLSDKHIIELSETFCINTSIKNLDLSHNLISDQGAIALSKYLSCPTSQLTTLSLSNNKISTTGLSSISQALRCKTSTLKTLLLGMNQVNDESGEQLFNGLMENTSLEIIDLSATQIGMKTIGALSHLMIQHPCLRQAFLSCNTFNSTKTATEKSDLAGKLLYEALSVNKCMINLDLRGTDISDEFSESIQSICRDNKFVFMNLK